jgi:peptidoglycan-associated lipoprotein
VSQPSAIQPPEEIREVVPPPPTVPQLQTPLAEPPPAQRTPPITEPSDAGLADVYFDYDRFMLRSEARKTLEANAQLLKSKNGWRVLIEGHCDERGTVDYNLVLGERRARSVKSYLEDLGVPSGQLQIVTYGKEKPVCVKHTENCWQQNRRAHFVLK